MAASPTPGSGLPHPMRSTTIPGQPVRLRGLSPAHDGPDDPAARPRKFLSEVSPESGSNYRFTSTPRRPMRPDRASTFDVLESSNPAERIHNHHHEQDSPDYPQASTRPPSGI